MTPRGCSTASSFVSLLSVFLATVATVSASSELDSPVEDTHGVRLPSKCEVCKILAFEIKERMKETEKSETIRVGSVLDGRKAKTFDYRTSELRLTEVLEEPNVCDRVKEYSLHKERNDSTRFAPGVPQTFKALHGLVNRGVNVSLGIPYDLWNTTTAEVSSLQKQCYSMLLDYEETIHEWYFHHQEKRDLSLFLCKDHVLGAKNSECLYEGKEPVAVKRESEPSSADSTKKEL